METLVLNLCGLWLWITRKSRTSRYSEVAGTLASARSYLWTDYSSRFHTRAQTSQRFDSLSECRKLIWEELSHPTKAA